MMPNGQLVTYDGQTYIVTVTGDVYVQTGTKWRILPKGGTRAIAVRHQARHGHSQ